MSFTCYYIITANYILINQLFKKPNQDMNRLMLDKLCY